MREVRVQKREKKAYALRRKKNTHTRTHRAAVSEKENKKLVAGVD